MAALQSKLGGGRGGVDAGGSGAFLGGRVLNIYFEGRGATLVHACLTRSGSKGAFIDERKKHPKKICIKDFGGTLAGGSRRGLRRLNSSLCRCWFFPGRIQCIQNFEGGGLRGSWGWGLRSSFGAPFLYVYVLFLGLDSSWKSKVLVFFRV